MRHDGGKTPAWTPYPEAISAYNRGKAAIQQERIENRKMVMKIRSIIAEMKVLAI